MKDSSDMFGGEADRVVVVGVGHLEAISRARVSLAVLFCCHHGDSREYYNLFAAGYRAAIEQGLVEVALPPWHPQISNLGAMLPTPLQSDAAAGEIGKFHNWAGRGAADLILPDIEELSDDVDEGSNSKNRMSIPTAGSSTRRSVKKSC